MREEVSVASQLSPGIDAAVDAGSGPVVRREVPRRDPKPLHSEARHEVAVPGGLVRWKEMAKLLECGDEIAEQVAWGHKRWYQWRRARRR